MVCVYYYIYICVYLLKTHQYLFHSCVFSVRVEGRIKYPFFATASLALIQRICGTNFKLLLFSFFNDDADIALCGVNGEGNGGGL